MKEKGFREFLVIVTAVALAFTVAAIFVQGDNIIKREKTEKVREALQEEMDKDSFYAGAVVGVEASAMEGLYAAGVVRDEDYNRLAAALKDYMEHPTKENQKKWNDLYLEIIKLVPDGWYKPETTWGSNSKYF